MIRTAAILLGLLAVPASAATRAQCDALVARLPIEVSRTRAVGGVCLLSGVRFGVSPSKWRAERVTLSGDVDALPDALPARLSGGVIGLLLNLEPPRRPGMTGLLRPKARPGMTLTFDMTAEDGVLRVNSLVFRIDETNEIALTARLAGLPEVWPVHPTAAANVRLQALDMEVQSGGRVGPTVLRSLGPLLKEATQDPEPQLAALRDRATAFLSRFASTEQAANAAQLQAFVDALPEARGRLEIGLGGAGVGMAQLPILVSSGLSAGPLARVADAAALDVVWTPAE